MEFVSPSSDAVQLPSEFELRYAVGRVLEFVPVFATMIAFFAFGGTSAPVPMAGAVGVFLLMLTVMSAFQAKRMRSDLERMARLCGEGALPTVDSARSNVFPLILAIKTVGIIYGAIKGDFRWFIIACALSILLFIGLFLRWFIFDRWYRKCALVKAPHG
jgi:hypothetical protein